MDRQVILDELKRVGGNLSKVANALDLDYFTLKQEYGSEVDSYFPQAKGPEPEDIGSLAGNPNLAKYVIAVKPRGAEWPSHYDDVIRFHRKRFNHGLCAIMSETSRNGWVILYSIPFQTPLPRGKFFEAI
jgi:hypothetical protein